MTAVRIAVWLPVGMLVAGCSAAHSTSSADEVAVLHRTVSLNDNERLDAPPAGARPALSAARAWRMFAERSGSTEEKIPSGMTAYLAVFSAGRIKSRLVYGYREPGCHPLYTMRAPSPYPTTCTGWQILDASTSNELDLAWEGLPG